MMAATPLRRTVAVLSAKAVRSSTQRFIVIASPREHIVLVEHVLSKAADLYLAFALGALYLTLPYRQRMVMAM